MGAPVYDGVVATDAVTAAIGTGAAHVRVNFRLDKWKSLKVQHPGDAEVMDQRDRLSASAVRRGGSGRAPRHDVRGAGRPASADVEVVDAPDGGAGFAGDGGAVGGGAGAGDDGSGVALNDAPEPSAPGCGCRETAANGGAGAKGLLFGVAMVAFALRSRRRARA